MTASGLATPNLTLVPDDEARMAIKLKNDAQKADKDAQAPFDFLPSVYICTYADACVRAGSEVNLLGSTRSLRIPGTRPNALPRRLSPKSSGPRPTSASASLRCRETHLAETLAPNLDVATATTGALAAGVGFGGLPKGEGGPDRQVREDSRPRHLRLGDPAHTLLAFLVWGRFLMGVDVVL